MSAKPQQYPKIWRGFATPAGPVRRVQREASTSGRGVLALCTALSLGVTAQAAAADQGYARRFYPSAVLSPYLTLDGTRTHGEGQVAFSAMGTFEQRPLVLFDEDERRADVIEYRLTTDLTLAYGPLAWLDLGVAVPVVLTQQGRNIDDDADLASFAFADPGLTVKATLLDKGAWPVGAALLAGVTLPLGDADAFAGEANATAFGKLALEYPVTHRLDVALNGGYRARERSRINQVFVDDELMVGLGVSWRQAHDLALVGDVNVATRIQGAFLVPEETPGDVNAGVRWHVFQGAQLVFGAGAGVLPGYGSPTWRVFLGFEAVPRRHDFDDDRVADGDDDCLSVPGPVENAGCPRQVASTPRKARPKRNDKDNDGVLDISDMCPYLAEDRDGFRDDDGCPDPDNDLDFIADVYDADPVGAEDWDGFEDDDGIPDLDNDRDGVADYVDACPNDPGGADGCGAPPASGGVASGAAGTLSDVPRPGGPDAPLVLGGLLHPARPIIFEFARAELTEDAERVVDGLAEFLKSNADLGRIEVGVHVDSMGSRRWKHGLSRRRAKVVVDELVERGVERKRLIARGYGPEVPVATNKDKAGRLKNRRVELRILRGMVATKGSAPRAGRKGRRLPAPRDAWLAAGVVVLRPVEPIVFEIARPTLTAGGRAQVKALAAQLEANPAYRRVEVGVHTDGRGDTAWKVRLSTARAKAVVAALVGFGVDASRLVPKGYGATRRLTHDKSKASRFLNRRVELVVLEDGSMSRLEREGAR